ncbi:hypothetical protein EDD15DRAFT_2322872 [Pisolithus albus]|nr:hypothetical protein EDD15DRAFT_2322872 [Pisolithus albus]
MQGSAHALHLCGLRMQFNDIFSILFVGVVPITVVSAVTSHTYRDGLGVFALGWFSFFSLSDFVLDAS